MQLAFLTYDFLLYYIYVVILMILYLSLNEIPKEGGHLWSSAKPKAYVTGVRGSGD